MEFVDAALCFVSEVTRTLEGGLGLGSVVPAPVAEGLGTVGARLPFTNESVVLSSNCMPPAVARIRMLLLAVERAKRLAGVLKRTTGWAGSSDRSTGSCIITSGASISQTCATHIIIQISTRNPWLRECYRAEDKLIQQCSASTSCSTSESVSALVYMVCLLRVPLWSGHHPR